LSTVYPLFGKEINAERILASASNLNSIIKMNSTALFLIKRNLGDGNISLNLGSVGLTDSDFVHGTPIDAELKKCRHLQVLILSNTWWKHGHALRDTRPVYENKLTEIPAAVSSLKNLRVLICGGQDDKNWGIRDISNISNLKTLTWIDLSNNKIEHIEELRLLVNLRRLNLSGNNIISIAPLINLTDLHQANLSKNKINSLEGLENLVNLEILFANNNRLTHIAEIKGLSKLIELDLRNNLLKSVDDIAHLTSLERLDIGENQIESLNSLKFCKNLSSLNVDHNRVTDLTPLLQFIKKGTTSLNIVIKDTSALKNKEINIADNPLTIPPTQIAERGNDSILNYFESIGEQGFDYLYEAKMLIVGQPRAGKTSLKFKLFDSSANLPDEDQTTRGIDISRLKFDITDKNNESKILYCNVWDFGGQHIYQATHQFFLTQRSLYVLVIDTGRDDLGHDESNLNYWLQVLELLGGKSPMFLVKNEKNDRGIQIDIFQKKKRFDFLKEDYKLNLNSLIPDTPTFNQKRLADFEQFKVDIQNELKDLPLVGFPMPKNWIKIRDKLLELSQKEYFISREAFIEICLENDVIDFKRQMELSGIFHDLGLLLHFQNYPNLEDFIILQNTWATDAVFVVLDNPIIKENYGKFTENDLVEVWGDKSYNPKVHSKLLSLMMQFEVCYQLDKIKPQTYIIPEMLPSSSPKGYVWTPRNDLPLYYKYDFMPKGIATRLIVRFNKHLSTSDGQQIVWKSGMKIDGKLLDCPETEAEIVETWDNRQIRIRIHGPYAKDLMSKLTFQIDDLNNELFKSQVDNDKINWHKMIPCICKVCQQNEVKHYYEYAELLERKQYGKENVECKMKPYELVDIRSLLEGILVKEMYNPILVPSQKTVKIFLASSSELKDERDQFEIFIYRENKRLIKSGVFLQLEIWEDFIDHVSQTRSQDEYNSMIQQCDVFVMLYFTKVGLYTLEEFEKALSKYKETNLPKIYTYFKKGNIMSTDVDRQSLLSLLDFQDKLKSLGHFQTDFENHSQLQLHFKKQLEKLYEF